MIIISRGWLAFRVPSLTVAGTIFHDFTLLGKTLFFANTMLNLFFFAGR
jgi:hypothetical protein